MTKGGLPDARRRISIRIALFLLLVPTGGTAQSFGADCELQNFRVWQRVGPIDFVGGPVVVCPNGTRIRADSAVVYIDIGRNELIGRVEFDNGERRLTSTRADYYDREGRLVAVGNVDVVDRIRGSEIHADSLILLESGSFRNEDELTAWGERPSATLPLSSPEGEAVDPYHVTADRLRFLGARFFWADGDVEIERETLTARADSLIFDQTLGELILVDSARVESEDGIFEGERINLLLPDDRLQSVVLTRSARVLTEGIEAVGDEIRILFENEQMQGLVSTYRPGQDEIRPYIHGDGYRMEGDSVEIRSPDGVVETVYATGRARAVAGEEGETADWVQAAEISALFVEVQVVEGGEPEIRLDRLVAVGGAGAHWRMTPGGAQAEEIERERWPISYVLADDITIFMVDGALQHVEATGNVRGVQVEARPAPVEPMATDPRLEERE